MPPNSRIRFSSFHPPPEALFACPDADDQNAALVAAEQGALAFPPEPMDEHQPCFSQGDCYRCGIDKAVTEFKKRTRYTGEPKADRDNLSKRGQFFWTRRIRKLVNKEWEKLKKLEPHMSSSIRDKVDVLRYNAFNGAYSKRFAYELMNIIPTTVWGDRVRRLVEPRKIPRGNTARALWRKLVKAKPTKKFPTLGSEMVNLHVLAQIRRSENTICGGTADRVQQIANAVPRRTFKIRIVGYKKEKYNQDDRGRAGIRAEYRNEIDQIREIKQAIDECTYPEARVISGVRGRGNGRQPEHSVLLIGYEHNKFVFWDPDAAVTKAHSRAFGFLYSANNNFTTARMQRRNFLKTDENGLHKTTKEKRYQVVRFR